MFASRAKVSFPDEKDFYLWQRCTPLFIYVLAVSWLWLMLGLRFL